MAAFYDVIVIGAGPAGLIAARTSAAAGLHTVLMEKRAIDRPKVCGGAVSERALKLLDLPIPGEIIDAECFGIRAEFGPYHTEVHQDKRLAMLISRSKFDAYLTRQAVKAGAELHEKEPAVDLFTEKDCVKVVTPKGTYTAQAAVIADGVHSNLARRVHPPFDKNALAICLTMEIPADPETIERVCGRSILIAYGITRTGYIWLFPKGDHISAGLGEALPPTSGAKDRFLRYLRSKGLSADAPLQGAPLPLKGVTEQIVADRILLAGDTGGFVDAFTGEGIFFAMHSGKLAAETLAEAAAAGDFSAAFLDRYRLRCKESFLDELKVAVRLTRTLYRFPNLLLKTAVRHPEVMQRYLGFFSGESNYTKFSRWYARNFLRLYAAR